MISNQRCGDADRQLKESLQAVLDSKKTELAGFNVTSVADFGDGHSGLTYLVTVEKGQVAKDCVLRTSVPGAPLRGPGDIGRQGRIMKGLASCGLPVPWVYAESSEGLLNGRSFALMEYVEGRSAVEMSQEVPHVEIAREAVDFLHTSRNVPLDRVDLGNETVLMPSDEVERWSRLLQRAPEYRTGAGEQLAQRLIRDAPPLRRTALVHGDFHYGNMIFVGKRLAGVVDFEIATVSDQLFDLACLAVASLRAKYEPEPNTTGSLEVKLSQLAEMYGVRSSDVQWFVSASCLKYSAIIAYNLHLHRSGMKRDPIYEQLTQTMMGLIDDGASMIA